MSRFSVQHYKIYEGVFDNWNSEVLDRWVYDDFVADPDYKKKWVSLTSLAYHAKSDSVYVGIGSFSAELLWRFDRKEKKFVSCGYESVGERFDAKLHRSIELDGDTLYGGVALFHDIDKQFEATGGRIFQYDIQTGEYRFLARPWKPAYIQSIALDRERKVIYGFGALPEVFFAYDLNTGESRLIAHIGNGCEFAQSHNPVIDREGCVWGTYGIVRAFSYRTGPDSIRLMKYDPNTDRVTFFKHGLPKTDIPGDKGKPDMSILGPDGMLYIGTDHGTLARINPATAEVTALCKPNRESKRMAALAFHPNGLLYGFTGEHYAVELFAYDTANDKLLWSEPVFDDAANVRPDRIHHMVIADDKTIYAGENDNNDRSSYLWEVTLH